jgi:GNAT superfamily N-acetyltransferase
MLPSTLTIRPATLRDVATLAALNRAAYPDLLEDGVVWSEDQLRAHLERFPEGQLVAGIDGAAAGAISTFVLPNEIDPLARHTWLGVTEGGWFTRHDPKGDTLYLADVYVAPDHWGRGVGKALYGALFSLCQKLGRARVVAGGRLWGYTDHADTMSVETYVARVAAGELRDRVLQSQLRAGFVVRGILPDYLHDWRSRHYATLLEWQNPDVASAHAGHDAVRVVARVPAPAPVGGNR